MILSYDEAVKKYGTDYKLKKAVEAGDCLKIENGV